jgi:hypothetical protein
MCAGYERRKFIVSRVQIRLCKTCFVCENISSNESHDKTFRMGVSGFFYFNKNFEQ